MASNEVCLVDQVCRLDWMFTESQVRYCQTAGFFGVICKVTLCVHVSLVTDDLDRCLVGTYCTVGTQTPELTFDSSLRFSCDTFHVWK